MNLKAIYFDSFKSLVNEKLEINHNCTGIVGINESGKSNILQAIRILNKDFHLEKKHVPKIDINLNPKLRFHFSPREDQEQIIKNDLQSWFDTNTLVDNDLDTLRLSIEYSVELNLDSEKEVRSFRTKIQKYELKDYVILKREFFDAGQKLFVEGKFISLDKAIVVSKSVIEKSEEDVNQLKRDIGVCEERLSTLQDERLEFENYNKEEEETSWMEEFEELEGEIFRVEAELKELKEQLEFDIDKVKSDLEKEIVFLEEQNNNLTKSIEYSKEQINTLKSKTNSLNAHEKGQLTRQNNNLKIHKEKSEKNTLKIKDKKEKLNVINTPLSAIYTDEIADLGKYFSQFLEADLDKFLPKIVFWEYSEDFILKSRTNFDEILKKKDLTEISRPLLNVFRVGLKIDSLEGLKNKIKLIQEDDGERSRINDQLNENLNAHIDSVWADYDQDVKITLEEHQIRIEFYDPKFKGKSYFKMSEKSQGAQTFLSFLMTVGAEAAQGVLKNTILLLDEPETHLHPSGVRFMLRELIKISEKSNIVIYATHSIFMIDTKNYNRHIYLVKNEERTSINPSKKDRIGYFMQEEVLFSALDFDLENDLNTKNVFNFVFEGKGDALIFKDFYEKTLGDSERPFSLSTSTFYQGGKCSDIKKFLIKNPMKLGAKWIFIIDDDKAASELKNFLTGKYGNYIDKDIFIFQYGAERKSKIELEDLLPEKLLKSAYKETCESLSIKHSVDKVNQVDWVNNFSEIHRDVLTDLNVTDTNKFTAEWKTILNSLIEESCNVLTKSNLENDFPAYSVWFNSTILKLRKE